MLSLLQTPCYSVVFKIWTIKPCTILKCAYLQRTKKIYKNTKTVRPCQNIKNRQYKKVHCTSYIFSTVRHSTAISYPSIESLFNGCQGHPPFCLPPGTAQRQPDRIKKGSNAQQFIQLTVVGDINAKSGWSLKTEKIHWLWHVYIDTTHTLRHLFPTWTSLYLSTFLKT